MLNISCELKAHDSPAEGSDSVGSMLDWGSKGFLVEAQPPAVSLCFILKQITLSAAYRKLILT